MFPVGILPILFGLAAALLPVKADATAPSGQTWFTLSTPNFRVHHTAPLEPYARRFGLALERALPALESRLKWKMPGPVDVVVMDNSDSANGLAANFPSTYIHAFAAPFDHDSSLSHYVDWVNELAIHELTHIIANDTALGYYLTLRKIFGSWVKPNGLQPNWLVEGPRRARGNLPEPGRTRPLALARGPSAGGRARRQARLPGLYLDRSLQRRQPLVAGRQHSLPPRLHDPGAGRAASGRTFPARSSYRNAGYPPFRAQQKRPAACSARTGPPSGARPRAGWTERYGTGRPATTLPAGSPPRAGPRAATPWLP
jgi:hypothetical protein